MKIGTAILFALVLGCLTSQAKAPADQTTLQGKLNIENGTPFVTDSNGVKTRLSSADDSIAATLNDARLSGREFRLIGRTGPDGSFHVTDFYILHGSTLYRLIYYCDTCHITTFRPGNCVCCQQPTVPTEVPLSDPRVHQENIKPLPSK